MRDAERDEWNAALATGDGEVIDEVKTRLLLKIAHRDVTEGVIGEKRELTG